jgi:hypothetical protein
MAKKPFGNLAAPPEPKAPTAKGFYVWATRQGIDPARQCLVEKGEKFYLHDPKFFSDADKPILRRGKASGIHGWMSRVDPATNEDHGPSAPPEPATGTGDTVI